MPPPGTCNFVKEFGQLLQKKKKKVQCFLAMVVFFLFAFLTPSEPLFGVLSCLNPLVCVSGEEAGP